MRRFCTAHLRAAAASLRNVSTDHKEIVVPNSAPKPPMASFEPVVPLDFDPHIEWYEFPQEIYSNYYPHTRDERITHHEINVTYSREEVAQKYGVRFHEPHKFSALLAMLVNSLYPMYFMWSCYRAFGAEANYYDMVQIMQAEGAHVEVEEDDLFLDVWMGFTHKGTHFNHDNFSTWRPPVKEGGAKTAWVIPFEHKDVSEFRHMLSSK